MTTEQGGRRQIRETMAGQGDRTTTEQGDDDRAGGQGQGRGAMAE